MNKNLYLFFGFLCASVRLSAMDVGDFTIRSEECATCPNKSQFSLGSTKTPQVKIALPSDISKVLDFKLYKDIFIIIGEVSSNTKMIVLVDHKDLKIIDAFIAFSPKVSISGRFITYTKFYPRFAPIEVKSDVFLIYDLDKSPEGNRIAGSYTGDNLQADVGIPLVFGGDQNSPPSYTPWIENSADRLVFIDQLWHPSEDILLASFEKGNEVFFLSLQLMGNELKPIVRPFSQCKINPDLKFKDKSLKEIERNFYPGKIIFSLNGNVIRDRNSATEVSIVRE